MGRVDSKLFSSLVHPPIRNHGPLDLPPIAFPVSPFVHAACYFFLPLSETRFNIRTMPDDAFLFRRQGRRLRSTQRSVSVAVVIPPPRIRYVGITTSRGGSKGRGEEGRVRKKPRPRWCRARADRWGVKPPIKRPLVSARRTGDISISSIALKLLVTSRVFREQRGTDQEGWSRRRKSWLF